MENSLIFAKLCQIAYEKFEVDDSTTRHLLNQIGFELKKLFSNEKSGTQAYLAESAEFEVLCFRGTEKDGLDILTDLRFKMSPTQDGPTHSGFFQGYASIETEIQDALNHQIDKPLYLCGHSLGGALAMVAALSLDVSVKACVTFGAPPIGPEEVSKKIKIEVFRYVNDGDVVPRSMQLGGPLAGILFLAIKGLHWLFTKLSGKPPKWMDQIKAVSEFPTILGAYHHHFDAVSLDPSGKQNSVKAGEDSLRLFVAQLGAGLKRAIEDHKMAEYISRIEKFQK